MLLSFKCLRQLHSCTHINIYLDLILIKLYILVILNCNYFLYNKIMKKIVCGKFDNIINFDKFVCLKQSKIRIGSINPNKLTREKYIPISTKQGIIFHNGMEYNSREFLSSYNSESLDSLIVLTYKERELILEELIDFNVKLKVFEKIYPIFDDIKFSSSPYINYIRLCELIKVISDFEFYGLSLSKYISTKYLYKIERKLKFKSSFDNIFAFAYKGGYQEVFKLKEERVDRCIIAMDFNSMYPDSMQGMFLEPKSIRYKKFENYDIDITSLNFGLYHIILSEPLNTFFKNFHPFKYVRLFQSFYFNLENEHEIEILLFKNEIEYYSKFFKKVKIIEGFYSNNLILHPLGAEARNLYNERLKHKKCGNKILEKLSKFKLITLHSASNRKKFEKKIFSTKKHLKNYLSKNYMLNIPEDTKELLYINNQEKFKFYKNKNNYLVNSIKLNSCETIYSLSSQVVSNSRLKMIKTIESFLSFDSVEICYCNVDSIHISIQKDKVDKFFDTYKYLFSEKMGNLKVESISDKGYWFDTGRYWLFKNNQVEKYKNIIFNKKGEKKEFIKNIKLQYVVKNDFYDYVKTSYKNIFSSFSYHKKVNFDLSDTYSFSRYNFKEIESLDVAIKSMETESLNSKHRKVELLNQIATV